MAGDRLLLLTDFVMPFMQYQTLLILMVIARNRFILKMELFVLYYIYPFCREKKNVVAFHQNTNVRSCNI